MDVVLVEIGGTVGDIESMPFLEAIRQFRLDVGRENTLYIHLTLVPFIGTAGELKTKPTQHSVRDLRSIGIQPDVLLCRTDRFLDADIKRKIALFCDVTEEAVITAKDVDTIYEVPLVLKAEGLDQIILKQLGLPLTRGAHRGLGGAGRSHQEPDRRAHDSRRRQVHRLRGFVQEPQRSGVSRRLRAPAEGAAELGGGRGAREAKAARALLDGAHGILVPGGFGSRGTRGMMKAAEYAREHGVPFFGICYGFQWATVEFARNVCGLDGADSTEVDENAPHKVIYKLRDLLGVDDLGGTMRLGRYACELAPGSVARAHLRHVADPRAASPPLRVQLPLRAGARARTGMRVSGRSPDGKFVEIAELPSHPWFVAVQFHPEFQSKPLRPHPLFASFVEAALPAQDRASWTVHGGLAGSARAGRCPGSSQCR